VKAVFERRVGTGYNDDAPHRYHVPKQYLDIARQAEGDWVVYRETRKGGGRQAYFAVARFVRLEPDPANPGWHFAIMADYLPFDAVVPLRSAQGFYESFLGAVADSSKIGIVLRGKSIRTIPDAEFAVIVRAGLSRTLSPENAVQLGLDPQHVGTDVRELLQAPIEVQQRRIAEILTSRLIRDAAFRGDVLDAYDNTCAVTGLRIVNGGGKVEVQAAHIWAVADGGPDVVQNGIALTATAHWLFDRHLISLTDDFGLLVSHNKVPSELRQLFSHHLERIRLPKDRTLWPHPAYVERHREKFAGA